MKILLLVILGPFETLREIKLIRLSKGHNIAQYICN